LSSVSIRFHIKQDPFSQAGHPGSERKDLFRPSAYTLPVQAGDKSQ
jgi:hypothetical protein